MIILVSDLRVSASAARIAVCEFHEELRITLQDRLHLQLQFP
jgi:hypothetical protein